MNYKLNTTKKASLLDLIAEKLLEKGFSVSYKIVKGTEFLSASFQYQVEDKKIFLAFDPVEMNVAVFLALLSFLNHTYERNIVIVVPAEGEREILRNIFKMQEIKENEVFSLPGFASYPLQLVK